jgi:hypothetical protein
MTARLVDGELEFETGDHPFSPAYLICIAPDLPR